MTTRATALAPTRAHILEIGEFGAGILVRADGRHVRFHAAVPALARLEGRLFRSAREATDAVTALLSRTPRRPVPPAPEAEVGGRDRTAELMLAAYGPFQTL